MNKPGLTVEEIWQRYDDDEQRLTAGVSERMLDLAKLSVGQRVLDIATGRGEPAIRAAKRVGNSGYVLGIDLAESMLKMARQRADRESIVNLELRAGDAQSIEVGEHQFDVVLARWGLMYMDDPTAALKNAQRALKPKGKFVAAFWAEPERVEYFTLPRSALSKYKTVAAISPESPGTFRFASLAQIERDLSKAGFRVEQVEDYYTPVMEASTSEDLIAWVRAFGLERLVQDLPASVQTLWEKDVVEAAASFRSGSHFLLGGTTRIVLASPDQDP